MGDRQLPPWRTPYKFSEEVREGSCYQTLAT